MALSNEKNAALAPGAIVAACANKIQGGVGEKWSLFWLGALPANAPKKKIQERLWRLGFEGLMRAGSMGKEKAPHPERALWALSGMGRKWPDGQAPWAQTQKEEVCALLWLMARPGLSGAVWEEPGVIPELESSWLFAKKFLEIPHAPDDPIPAWMVGREGEAQSAMEEAGLWIEILKNPKKKDENAPEPAPKRRSARI